MKKLPIVILMVLSMAHHAKAFNCDAVKQDYLNSGKIIHSKQNNEALEDAIDLYEISSELCACIYPELVVEEKPIGEYENFEEGGPSIVTLTHRRIYRLGDYVSQTALISIPDDMNISVVGGEGTYRLVVTPKGFRGIYVRHISVAARNKIAPCSE
jgi:hypothetical protein